MRGGLAKETKPGDVVVLEFLLKMREVSHG
jgi:hypothetical protein